MSIIKGFSNLILKEERELAKERKAICKECPVCEFGKSRFCKLRNGGCGCLISAKVSDPEEECPKKKWLKMEKVWGGDNTYPEALTEFNKTGKL